MVNWKEERLASKWGTDNRLPWILNAAQELAHCMDEEEECLRKYDEAKARRQRVEIEIKRLTGYVEEHVRPASAEVAK